MDTFFFRQFSVCALLRICFIVTPWLKCICVYWMDKVRTKCMTRVFFTFFISSLRMLAVAAPTWTRSINHSPSTIIHIWVWSTFIRENGKIWIRRKLIMCGAESKDIGQSPPSINPKIIIRIHTYIRYVWSGCTAHTHTPTVCNALILQITCERLNGWMQGVDTLHQFV